MALDPADAKPGRPEIESQILPRKRVTTDLPTVDCGSTVLGVVQRVQAELIAGRPDSE